MPDSNQVVRYGRREFVQHEAPAAADVRAGHLVEEVAGGVQPHSAAGGVMDRTLVCVDARDWGKELGDTYDGAAGERTKYISASGGGVHLLLATGQSVSDGDRLVSNGDGAVRVIDQDGTAPDDPDDAVVATVSPDESVDNTGGTEAVPVAVEVAN